MSSFTLLVCPYLSRVNNILFPYEVLMYFSLKRNDFFSNFEPRKQDIVNKKQQTDTTDNTRSIQCLSSQPV